MNQETYRNMQKNYYEGGDPVNTVGNYAWHERFPYEEMLLKHVPETKGKVALDFACGMGRMILRMQKYFDRVDGVDISQKMLNAAINHNKVQNSNLYLSSGLDIGDAKNNKYDFIYSTIAIQHIACRSIRNSLIEQLSKTLNPDGRISIQMAYTEQDSGPGAGYMDDRFDAGTTNGAFDAIITPKDIPQVIEDYSQWFTDVKVDLFRVDDKFEGKDNSYPFHNRYWASHWCFISGKIK